MQLRFVRIENRCVGFGDVDAAFRDGHDQLHFMVQVLALRRIGHVGVVQQQGIGRFHEEERRFPVRIAAHLPRMFGVVAPDAENPADGECATAGDRDGHNGGRRDDEIGHGEDPAD